LVAPSTGSGVSVVGCTVAETDVGVGVSKYPNGVFVGDDVALGNGVILGNGVNVIVGVSVADIGIAVRVAVGTAVRVCAFPVIARSGVNVDGTETGAGSVAKQADAASTVANAIKRGAFALFMVQSGERTRYEIQFLNRPYRQ
jgi:hypothetical protein